MIGGKGGHIVDRGHFVLGRGGLVVFSFGQYAQLPQLFVQLGHEGLDTGFDGTGVMIVQLLSLGRLGAKEGAAGEDQVLAAVVELLIHQEVLLLRTDGGGDAGGVPAEELQDAHRLLVQRLHGAQ